MFKYEGNYSTSAINYNVCTYLCMICRIAEWAIILNDYVQRSFTNIPYNGNGLLISDRSISEHTDLQSCFIQT